MTGDRGPRDPIERTNPSGSSRTREGPGVFLDRPDPQERRTMRIRRWLLGPYSAIAVILGIAASADAQLFPNLPLHKRQRPDCALEKPVFGQYRHQYYGYFPTCWRRFPPGWGCPTPEAPNWEQEVARRPLEIPDTSDLKEPEQDNVDPFGGGDLPPLPEGRSPFELDAPGGNGAGAAPAGRDNPPTLPRPTDAGQPDPFSTPADPFDVLPPRPSTTANPSTPEVQGGLPPISPPSTTTVGTVYQPGSDLPPPSLSAASLSPSQNPRTIPVTNPSFPSVIPSEGGGNVPGTGGGADSTNRPLISPAMGPRPTYAIPSDGLNGGLPMGSYPPGGSGVIVNGSPGIVGDDPRFSGDVIEMPPAEGQIRPGGRIRGFVSGLLFGRGLRR